jgi:hypothetical protein
MKKFIFVFSLLFGSSLLSANSLAVSDQQFLFGKTQNIEAQLISNNEMAETEGRFVPISFGTAVWGGFIGGVDYAVSHTGSNWNWGDFRSNVGYGAVMGFVGPMTTAQKTISLGLGMMHGIYDYNRF